METNPMDKIQDLTTKGRSFRNFASFDIQPQTSDSAEMTAEGVACVFNQATTLFSMDGIDYKEVIDARAFDGCDMSDVIFNYNHAGKVMARTRNKTLDLRVDANGLNIRAKLDGTVEGRNLYEEIRGGYIDRMSFAFSVLEDVYDQEAHTRTIKKVKKLYDTSAVDIPAYNTTSLNARSMINADAEIMAELDSSIKQKRQRLQLILEMEGFSNE